MPEGNDDAGFSLSLFECVFVLWSFICFVTGFVLRGSCTKPPPKVKTRTVSVNCDPLPTTSSKPAAPAASTTAALGDKVYFSMKSGKVVHLKRDCQSLDRCEQVSEQDVCTHCLRTSARLTRK